MQSKDCESIYGDHPEIPDSGWEECCIFVPVYLLFSGGSSKPAEQAQFYARKITSYPVISDGPIFNAGPIQSKPNLLGSNGAG
jgi:hypothetical protein